MAWSRNRVPKCRKHRASGQAIVTLSGSDHYLGPRGTKASCLASLRGSSIQPQQAEIYLAPFGGDPEERQAYQWGEGSLDIHSLRFRHPFSDEHDAAN
ncbi:hypothetical protein HG15A2_01650 [Adhaeretor mobilis]|uniref:Uncharacterized protein n=1 Tax=Adhaeretor mobilis TaxID=1930276 RepID=A0A517MPU2_9BACT|nr:hypothetical protein HG15A2_01650 [Adhaeretor mobilis]